MNKSDTNLENLVNQPYKYGFTTNVEVETIRKGLDEDIVRLISEKKEEPKLQQARNPQSPWNRKK